MDTQTKKALYEILKEAPPEMVRRANVLSGHIKAEQAKMGVHNPQCGTFTALEILARVGALLAESIAET